MLAQSAPTHLQGKFPISALIQNAKRQHPANLGLVFTGEQGGTGEGLRFPNFHPILCLWQIKQLYPGGTEDSLEFLLFALKANISFCSPSHTCWVSFGDTSGYVIPEVSQGWVFLILGLLGLRLKKQCSEAGVVVHTYNPWAWRGRKIRSQGCPLLYSEFEGSLGSTRLCFSRPKKLIIIVKKIQYTILLLASLINKY